MDEDGCSLITFFQNTKEYDNTVLVVQDQHGWKFGGFCTEAWRCAHTFFGNGQNFMFSYEDGDEAIMYKW